MPVLLHDAQPTTQIAQPIDMVLNQGTYSSWRCVDVLRRYDGNTSFRTYPSENNADLIGAIASAHELAPENVLVANGSGPLLKSGVNCSI
jgi:histidinol-phosphate/aromatic aminotransferase/cobyric acid decarboxylase-like protein